MSTSFKPCPTAGERAKCDNCGHQFKTADAGWIEDASERLEAGEEVPVGECPECGCCAYLLKPVKPMKDQDLKDTIVEFFNDHDKVCLNAIQDALALLIVEVMGSAPDCDDPCWDEEETLYEGCRAMWENRYTLTGMSAVDLREVKESIGEDRPEAEDSDIPLSGL